MRHADGAQRRVLQVRELRQHFRLQLKRTPACYLGNEPEEGLQFVEHRFGTSGQRPSTQTSNSRLFTNRTARRRAWRDVRDHLSPPGTKGRCAPASRCCGKCAGADRAAGADRDRLPTQRSARRAGRYSALWLGEYSGSVVERRRNDREGFSGKLSSPTFVPDFVYWS